MFYYFNFIIISTLALIIGCRPINVGSDTRLYFELYNDLLQGTTPPHQFEFAYDALARIFAFLGIGGELFFSFLAAIFLAFIMLAIKNFSICFSTNTKINSRFIFISWAAVLLSPVFFSGEVNVIRQGISCSSVILFYSSVVSKRYNFLTFISIVFAIGFHVTGILYLSLLIFCFFSYRCIFFFAGISLLFYLTGFSEVLLKIISELINFDIYRKIAEYGSASTYKSGIRVDFAVFSIVLGLSFDMLARVNFFAAQKKIFFKILKIYWIFLIPFFYFGFASFSDRYLFNAWIFSSIVAAIFILQASFIKVLPSLFFIFIFIVCIFINVLFIRGVNIL